MMLMVIANVEETVRSNNRFVLVNLFLIGVVIALAVVALAIKILIYRRMMASQKRIEHMQARTEESLIRSEKLDSEFRDTLRLIKDWAYSATARHKDAAAHHQQAAAKLEEVAIREANQPSRAEVAELVKQVPEKTAEEVVRTLKSSGSGDSGVALKTESEIHK